MHESVYFFFSVLGFASNLSKVLQADAGRFIDEDMRPYVLDKRVREEGSPCCRAIFSEDLEEVIPLYYVLGRKDLLDSAWEEDR